MSFGKIFFLIFGLLYTGTSPIQSEGTMVATNIENSRHRVFEREENGTFLMGQGETGIVFVPISWGTEKDWESTATNFAGRGFATARVTWTGNREADILRAVELLRREGAKKTIVVAACMGATIALGMKLPDSVAGLVAVSPVPRLGGYSVYPGIGAKITPLLLIGTKNDPLSLPQMLYEIAAAHKGTNNLKLLDGELHGDEIFRGNDSKAAIKLLDEFLREIAAGR